MTLIAPVARTAEPLLGEFRTGPERPGRGLELRFQGELTNLEELARRLNRPALEGDPVPLLTELYRRLGAGFVADLRGSFALAVEDPAEQRLLLARDRLGREPLFYSPIARGLAYSSRLERLACRPDLSRELDLEALNLYLAFQFFPLDRTAFRSVRKLPAGHLLELGPSGLSCSPYWLPAFDDQAPAKAQAELDRELEMRLLASFRRLPQADGPQGAFASGGIDSSTNLVFLSRSSRRAVALTAAFEDPDYDESRDAAEVASALSFEHRVVAVGERHLERLATLAAHLNEPIGDQAVLPTSVLLETASSDLSGIVSGEGGDELFGPPRRFGEARPLAEPVREVGALARDYAERIACCPGALRRGLLAGTSPEEEILGAPAALLQSLYRRSAATDRFFLLKLGQLFTWLPDNVLAKDRDLAGSRGLVARFPLIDDAVVELVSSLSPADHLAACLDKGLLRRQLAPFLPAGTLAKPKHRFLVPVCRWRGPAFLQAAQEALASPSSLTRDLYAPAAVANLLTGQASGDPAAARPLWALLVLEYWLRHIESVAKARDRWDR